nr:translation initiation factor IF-2 [Oryctolagus cuniculus]
MGEAARSRPGCGSVTGGRGNCTSGAPGAHGSGVAPRAGGGVLCGAPRPQPLPGRTRRRPGGGAARSRPRGRGAGGGAAVGLPPPPRRRWGHPEPGGGWGACRGLALCAARAGSGALSSPGGGGALSPGAAVPGASPGPAAASGSGRSVSVPARAGAAVAAAAACGDAGPGERERGEPGPPGPPGPVHFPVGVAAGLGEGRRGGVRLRRRVTAALPRRRTRCCAPRPPLRAATARERASEAEPGARRPSHRAQGRAGSARGDRGPRWAHQGPPGRRALQASWLLCTSLNLERPGPGAGSGDRDPQVRVSREGSPHAGRCPRPAEQARKKKRARGHGRGAVGSGARSSLMYLAPMLEVNPAAAGDVAHTKGAFVHTCRVHHPGGVPQPPPVYLQV